MNPTIQLRLEPNPKRTLDPEGTLPTSFTWSVVTLLDGDEVDSTLAEGIEYTPRQAALMGMDALLKHLPADLDAQAFRAMNKSEAHRQKEILRLTTPELSMEELSALTAL